VRRLLALLTALAVVLVVLGGVASARAGAGLLRTTTVVDGVPLTLVRLADDGAGPERSGREAGHPGAVDVPAGLNRP